jgi:hypothetical protein
MEWRVKLGMSLAWRFVVAGITTVVALAAQDVTAESGKRSRSNGYSAPVSAGAVGGAKTCLLPKRKNYGPEVALVSRVDGALEKARGLRAESLTGPSVQAQMGYEERLKTLLESPDLLHQRCWFEDQLSCTLFGSSLQDLRISLSKIIESDLKPGSSLALLTAKQDVLVIEMRRLENDLIEQCRKLPWNLG